MSNDLISCEALIEAINTYDKYACLPNCKLIPARNLEHPEMFEIYIHLKDVIKAIDNAPTVDINTKLSVAYLKGRRQGQSEERPTGRWLRTDDMYETLVCSKCDYDTGDYIRYNFCPNCGSRMIERSEEE